MNTIQENISNKPPPYIELTDKDNSIEKKNMKDDSPNKLLKKETKTIRSNSKNKTTFDYEDFFNRQQIENIPLNVIIDDMIINYQDDKYNLALDQKIIEFKSLNDRTKRKNCIKSISDIHIDPKNSIIHVVNTEKTEIIYIKNNNIHIEIIGDLIKKNYFSLNINIMVQKKIENIIMEYINPENQNIVVLSTYKQLIYAGSLMKINSTDSFSYLVNILSYKNLSVKKIDTINVINDFTRIYKMLSKSNEIDIKYIDQFLLPTFHSIISSNDDYLIVSIEYENCVCLILYDKNKENAGKLLFGKILKSKKKIFIKKCIITDENIYWSYRNQIMYLACNYSDINNNFIEENQVLKFNEKKIKPFFNKPFDEDFISDFQIHNSKNSKYIFAICNTENSIKIMDLIKKSKFEIKMENVISCITTYSDQSEDYLVACDNDIVRVWSMNTNPFEQIYFIDINAHSINSIYISSNKKIITISKNQINIFSNQSFEKSAISISNKVNSMLLLDQNLFFGASKSNFIEQDKKEKEKKSIHQVNQIVFDKKSQDFKYNISEIDNCDGTINSEVISILSIDNNKYLMIARSNKTVKVYDIDLKNYSIPQNEIEEIKNHQSNPIQARQEFNLNHHSDSLNVLIIASDNKTLISGSSDQSIRVWDWNLSMDPSNLASEKTLFATEAHKDMVMLLAINKTMNFLVSGGGKWDSIIKIWDFEMKKQIKLIEAHTSKINAIIISPDDQYLISASKDKKIKIWNIQNNYKLENELSGHKDDVTCMVLTSNNQIISGSKDMKIRIWDLKKGKPLGMLECNSGAVTSLAINEHDSILVTAGSEKKIRIWKLSTIQSINNRCNDYKSIDNENNINAEKFKSPSNANINAFAYHENPNFILCGKKDGSLAAWEYNSDDNSIRTKEINILNKDQNTPRLEIIKIIIRKESVITASKDNTIRKYVLNNNFSSLTEVEIFSTFENLFSIGMIPEIQEGDENYKKLKDDIFYCEGNKIKIVDKEQNKIELRLEDKNKDHADEIYTIICFTIKLNNRQQFFAATGGRDKIIKIWERDLKGLSHYKDLKKFNSKPIISLNVSLDGTKIISYSIDKNLLIIDWKASNIIVSFKEDLGFDICDQWLNDRLYFINGRCLDLFNNKMAFKNNFFNNKNEKPKSIYWKENNFLLAILNNKEEINKLSLASANLIDYMDNYSIFHRFFNKINEKINIFEESEFENILNGTILLYPYYYNFLHLNALFDEFSIENYDELHEISLDLFLQMDYKKRTCIDLLIESNNKTKLYKYFNLIFKIFPDASSFSKKRFLNYVGYSQNPMFDLLNRLMTIFGNDTVIIKKILDISCIEIEENITVEFNDDEKKFIILDNDYVDNTIIKEKIDIKDNISPISTIYERIVFILHFIISFPWYIYNRYKNQESASYKFNGQLICLKNATDFTDEEVKKFYESLYFLPSDNEIFKSKTLKLITNYKWEEFVQYRYICEFLSFLLVFLVFIINFAYLLPTRVYIDGHLQEYGIISTILNVFLLLNFVRLLYNECEQIYEFGRTVYFSSFWNIVDIILLILGITTCCLDLKQIYDYGDEEENQIKLTICSLTMFCFWLRVISFSRGFSKTSFMVRLIQTVVIDMRYFLLFIFIFIFTFSFTAHLLQNEFENSQFSVFVTFYRVAIGDLGQFDELKENSFNEPWTMGLMFLSTILIQIILFNLLISIIGSTYGNVVSAKDSARNFELIQLMFEIETDFKTLKDYYKDKREKNVIGPYLFYLYNDDNIEDEENIDKDDKILDFIEEDRNYDRRTFKKIIQGINNIIFWNEKTSEKLDRMNKDKK